VFKIKLLEFYKGQGLKLLIVNGEC